GLPPERIFIAASHTHRAPMTDDTKPKLGLPDGEYMEWVAGELNEAVARVLHSQDAVDVEMRVGTGTADHSINRRLRKRVAVGRRLRINQVVMAPNPSGETDESLGVIALVNRDEAPVALIWNYACHPVGYP